MGHPFGRKANAGSVSRRAKRLLASGGYVGCDASPFSSAADKRSSGKAEGSKRAKRFAKGGRVKKPHQTNITLHIHRPPMDAGLGAPGAAPMGGPPPGAGMPPPGMGGPAMPPPGMARGGMTAGARTGVGREQEADIIGRRRG